MQRRVFAGVVVAHLVAVATVAGCYEPTTRDCTIACSRPSDCTGGQVCGAEGFCAMPDTVSCREQLGELMPDAAADTTGGQTADASPDGPPPPDICLQGCSMGTCDNGVCVIDCSAAGSCTNDVRCPINLPCRVVCGDNACDSKVICDQSLDCDIQCIGENACSDEIICNNDACKVTCSGYDSCDKRVKCANACACDITCSGMSSCGEVSDCPEDFCRVGNACTSAIVGCNTCP